MTGHDDFDRTLAGWLEAEALSPAPAADLDRILEATRRRGPRPAWLADLGSHWVEETRPAGSSSGVRSMPRLGVRWSTALILLLALVALLGGAILVGARLLLPPSPPSGHLAYGLDGDIYVADWDGRNPVRIANGAPILPSGDVPCTWYGGEGPMWSPDGRYLAYRQGGAFCLGSIVFISDPAGRIVASFPGTGWLISWSPDSTRVATWVELSQTVGIYGLDGVRQALLSVPPGCPDPGDNDPIWSPDGKSVVIHGCEVPLDGRTPAHLPADDPRSHRAAYSPGERRVAFTTVDSSTESFIVAAADGSQPQVMISEVIPAWVESPRWSPTGDRIAFDWRSNIWQDQAGNPLPGTSELRVVDVASGAVKSLATAPTTFSLQVIAFSPEGDRVLFSRSDADNVGTSLWSVKADGSDARILVTGTGWGDWQPLRADP